MPQFMSLVSLMVLKSSNINQAKHFIRVKRREKMNNMFNKARIATDYKRIKTETKKKRKMTD